MIQFKTIDGLLLRDMVMAGTALLEKNRELVGRVQRVLCDGPSKNDPTVLSGRTDGNKIAFFAGDPADAGKFLLFRADRADAFAFYGEQIPQ